jgi:hypothetical protein
VSGVPHIVSTLLLGWCPPLILVGGSIALGFCVLPQRLRALPSPWPICLAAALGSQLTGIVTLVLATRGLVGPRELLAFLVIPLLLCGGLAVRRTAIGAVSASVRAWWELTTAYRIMLLLCGACYGLMALVASTPPTKHDDLWYQLMLAKRTMVEGIMRFYPSPFMLAVPEQSYSSSLVPLLRFGQPSAALAFGLIWSVVFVWCFWERARRRSAKRAAIGTTILVCAFSNVVWWTSASSTAMAGLVATFFLLWIVERESLRASLRPWEYFGVLGVLAAALCVAKISFLPAVAFLLCAAAYDEIRSEGSVRSLLPAVLAIGIPMAMLYAPWLWWTYAATGNPFGIFMVGTFGSTVFDPSRVHDTLESARQLNQFHLPGIDSPSAALRPVAGVIGFLREDLTLKQTHLAHLALAFAGGPIALARRRQWAILCAALAGSLVLGALVTHDLRFHAIVIDGFLLVAVLWWEPPRWGAMTRVLPAAVVMLTLPTLAASAYYSASFIRNAVGSESDDDFLTRYSGMYEVAVWCNANLPPDARACIRVHGLPRAFYFNRLALAPEHLTKQELSDGLDLPAYMLRNGLSYLVSTDSYQASKAGFVLLKQFDDCVLEGLRSPGATPITGTVYVYRLSADGGRNSK